MAWKFLKKKVNSKVEKERQQKIFEHLFLTLLVKISSFHLLKRIVVKGRFEAQATVPSEGMHTYDIL